MKKFNSFFFLFLLSLLLLFTSFIFVGQNLLHKNNVDNIISTFDTIKFLKENKAISNRLEEIRLPLDVLDYINSSAFQDVLSKGYDKLYMEEFSDYNFIETSRIEYIIRNSLNSYGDTYNVDIGNSLDDVIHDITNDITENVNTKEVADAFVIIKRIFNYYVFFAFILVDLAIMIYLILKEKLCSLPWLCAVNVVISFVVYKVGEVIANYHISDYFSIKSTFEKCVEPCYISLCLFGILCLIIYLIFKLKKWLVMAKVKYDDKVYWRE